MLARQLSKSLRRPLLRYLSSTGSYGVVLDGTVPKSQDFHANQQHMDKLVENFTNLTKSIHEGGGEVAKAKQRARNKLPARDRIDAFLDPGSPFLEVGTLAGHEMYGRDHVPCGGVITGIGKVNG
jgi:3-methylcrotonyl-CoA carboxylase beta subunit